jgi:hypothetical protein
MDQANAVALVVGLPPRLLSCDPSPVNDVAVIIPVTLISPLTVTDCPEGIDPPFSKMTGPVLEELTSESTLIKDI